ncbi:hypothetical protein EV137_7209 [Kribbella pratensis]|uniref:DUF308 domain-containing protein n=1 Tax=Kribbella pratensis TaxID=2512112 RepID=A0ABY2F8A5_9ACTN|nr:hypothetical protein [Kribbella pratensis]TDW84398.1 hypothetical protein EV137_7209 [Kribbella pratensis]
MTGRNARAWQGVVVGAAMIVIGVVLLANNVPILGVSALPIVGVGAVQLLIGVYQLLAARRAPGDK